MTTLEQRIAEAVRKVRSGTLTNPDGSTSVVFATVEFIARAVIAVLPTGDVTDEQIREALHSTANGHDVDTAVRSLLTAQATTHAGEMDAMRGERDDARDDARVRTAVLEADARRDAALLAAYAENRTARDARLLKAEADRDAALAEVVDVAKAVADAALIDRDRAVREALENAAQKIEADDGSGFVYWTWAQRNRAARIVRSLIEGGE